MSHVPRAYQAHLNKTLSGTESWVGSAPFFFFSENHVERRASVTYTDSARIYDSDWKIPGICPDFKLHYKNDRFVFDKPTVIINNKYISEWNRSPINFISLDSLSEIFNILIDDYTIIYIRANTQERGYWNDNQPAYQFDDYLMIEAEYPDVVCMNTLLEYNPDLTYNQLQLMLHANCNKFISIAGGNAVISSYFGGVNIVYRSAEAKSNDRVLWHTNSHLTQLSGATIIGVNTHNDLVNTCAHEF